MFDKTDRREIAPLHTVAATGRGTHTDCQHQQIRIWYGLFVMSMHPKSKFGFRYEPFDVCRHRAHVTLEWITEVAD